MITDKQIEQTILGTLVIQNPQSIHIAVEKIRKLIDKS
jgi:hypothetical protein